jgi:hypothetical protein
MILRMFYIIFINFHHDCRLSRLTPVPCPRILFQVFGFSVMAAKDVLLVGFGAVGAICA